MRFFEIEVTFLNNKRGQKLKVLKYAKTIFALLFQYPQKKIKFKKNQFNFLKYKNGLDNPI